MNTDVQSDFYQMMYVLSASNTTCIRGGAEIADHFRAPEFIPSF